MSRSLLVNVVGCMLLAAMFAGAVFATAPPAVQMEAKSPNEQFVMRIDLKTGIRTVFRSDDLGKPLWSFKQESGIRFVLSDDGQSIAEIHDMFVGRDSMGSTAVRFLNAQGTVHGWTFQQLCPEADSAPGEWGFGRDTLLWLGGDRGQGYRGDGRNLYLEAADGNRYAFDMATGEMTSKTPRPWPNSRELFLMVGLTFGGMLAIWLGLWERRRRRLKATADNAK